MRRKVTIGLFLWCLLKVVVLAAIYPLILFGVPYITGIDGAEFALYMAGAAGVAFMFMWAYAMASLSGASKKDSGDGETSE